MASPNERLATALEAMANADVNGIVRHDAIGKKLRQRLTNAGFLVEIIKGWYRIANPQPGAGDTAWFPYYWEFVRQYLGSRFGEGYCLSAEASILLHGGATAIPQQIVVIASSGSQKLELPGGLSIFIYSGALPMNVVAVRGIRIMALPEALVRVPEAFYRSQPLEAAVALRAVPDASQVLSLLLDGGKSVVARRLAGAFRANHQPAIADQIVATMKAASYEGGEDNPFDRPMPELRVGRRPSPVEVRVRTLWAQMRGVVAEEFPPAPGLPKDADTYMAKVEDAYSSDAYNSLSIEGYRVTPELIERVRSGKWNPEIELDDRAARDALAARGYFESFQSVQKSVDAIARGGSLAALRNEQRDWFRALFAPSVTAGILKPSDLAGYRNHPVFIKDSMHVPPPSEAVVDAMDVLYDLIEDEPEPCVRAVLGHFVFVFIHPYGDGNGRVARFLMNTMLASGGYPWTVIHLKNRLSYQEALEAASTKGDVAPFARFVAGEMRAGTD